MAAEKVFPRQPNSPTVERVAEDVWLLRGDLKRGMNIYFLREDAGVVQFDAGTKPMRRAAAAVAERLGGLRRIVLGHVDSDHRGSAPYLGAPVYCHPAEVDDAGAPGPYRPYWDMSKLTVTWVRWIYPALHHRWDGGPVKVAGTVEEGDDVAGFRVIHFPGHAPGLIGLWREADRLLLSSDAVYLVDSERLKGLPEGEASVPHPAWNHDHEQAKASVRKLAALGPAKVCAGHDAPLEGDIGPALERAAQKY